MRDILALLTSFALAAPARGAAQERTVTGEPGMDRDGRVVIYSPHFDVPTPRWGGLSCPAGPLHLYGFESQENATRPALRVRVFQYDPSRTREVATIVGDSVRSPLRPIEAVVQLTSRIDMEGEHDLPLKAPWVKQADSTGLAKLDVPTGVYRIRFSYPGAGGDEGVIRVREARSDSLHAYLILGAVCDADHR